MSKPKAPYIHGSVTSRAAAVAITPKLGRLQRLVFDFIAAQGDYGATDDEILVGLGLKNRTASPRRIELEDRQLVKRKGERRRTASGQLAEVYVITGLPGITPPKPPPKPTPVETLQAIADISRLYRAEVKRLEAKGLPADGPPEVVVKLMQWVKFMLGKVR